MKTDILVHKIDRRCKDGKVLVERRTVLNEVVEAEVFNALAAYPGKNHVVSILPWVERMNLMSKNMFWEPADTPTYCSPAFESYWTM